MTQSGHRGRNQERQEIRATLHRDLCQGYMTASGVTRGAETVESKVESYERQRPLQLFSLRPRKKSSDSDGQSSDSAHRREKRSEKGQSWCDEFPNPTNLGGGTHFANLSPSGPDLHTFRSGATPEFGQSARFHARAFLPVTMLTITCRLYRWHVMAWTRLRAIGPALPEHLEVADVSWPPTQPTYAEIPVVCFPWPTSARRLTAVIHLAGISDGIAEVQEWARDRRSGGMVPEYVQALSDLLRFFFFFHKVNVLEFFIHAVTYLSIKVQTSRTHLTCSNLIYLINTRDKYLVGSSISWVVRMYEHGNLEMVSRLGASQPSNRYDHQIPFRSLQLGPLINGSDLLEAAASKMGGR
ncbi:hypothetical protein ACLOJK_013473 [Asimina triloba]